MNLIFFTINLVGIIGLIFTIARGLRSRQEKRVTTWLAITRFLILFLVGLTITYQLYTLPQISPLAIIRGGYLIVLFIASESTFNKKRSSFGSPRQVLDLELLTMAGLIILPWRL